MKQPPLVYIVVLNWNGWQDTLACVASCRVLKWPNFRILVVDNGSTDGSEEILRRHLADIKILQTGANLGFSGGNNVGIRHALESNADYVWLLNNDAEVAPEALSRLVEAMESDPTVAMSGSKIYLHHDRQRLNFAGGIWDKGRLRPRLLGANQLDRGQFDEQCEGRVLSGCSLLVSAHAVREIGLMEESYFLYWEDTEWCVRAHRLGHKTLFVPKSHVWHKVSASTGKDSFAQHYYYTRNGFSFLFRYGPVWVPVFIIYDLLYSLKCLAGGNSQALKGFLFGLVGFLRGETGPIARR